METGGEVGIYGVELNEQGQKDPLFKGIAPRFDASFFHYYHLPTLPKGAIQLAEGDVCKIQAFSIGTIYGVQFHPDFDLENICHITEVKKEAIREALGDQKINLEGDLTGNVKVLQNFLEIVEEADSE
jgi:GMP synthase (glutamine-hydrolysing)